MKLNKIEKQLVQTERACSDLRRGMPVLVTSDKGKSIFVMSPDNIKFINRLKEINISNKRLVISTTRANYLFPNEKITTPISIKIDNLYPDEIYSLSQSAPYSTHVKYESCSTAAEVEKSALKLAKIAELIPSLIVFELNEYSEDFITLSTDTIDCYKESTAYNLHEACRTPLTLTHANNAEIVAYRANVGAPEHYAIIVGTPASIPLIRIHSSCYTGDLLASLDCDCRDQLQAAIEIMSKGNGGIILYLMQEGRGIGLVNKLRTYTLQDKGMDTVDANRAIGFDDDERLFLPAAEILKKLGIHHVNLLTNNPRKASGLGEYGINVVGCIPHIMLSNEHNSDYLKTKANRLGHKF